MNPRLDRRTFCQAASLGLAASACLPAGLRASPAAVCATPHAEKLGWHLGCQAYSFNRFKFYEAVDKNASLGLTYIEAYPGQKLSEQKPDAAFNDSLSPEDRAAVKKYLADAGVKLVNYGVVGLTADEAAARKIFDFAKDMGIETIVSEPPPEALEMLDKLCNEYQINLALHNHPKPSKYWDPNTVLEACKGRSKRIGSCSDTGHWMRSGVDPLEALKLLEGRIISFHFKDLNAKGDGSRKFSHEEMHDVPWGTGVGNTKALLTEIKRQGFRGVFSIEYEWNWTESLPEIAQCVKYFDQVAAELGG